MILDSTKLQMLAGPQAQIGTLSARLQELTVLEVVDAAIGAHKLVPEQRDWALCLGRHDMALLIGFLADAVPLTGIVRSANISRAPRPAGVTELTKPQPVPLCKPLEALRRRV